MDFGVTALFPFSEESSFRTIPALPGDTHAACVASLNRIGDEVLGDSRSIGPSTSASAPRSDLTVGCSKPRYPADEYESDGSEASHKMGQTRTLHNASTTLPAVSEHTLPPHEALTKGHGEPRDTSPDAVAPALPGNQSLNTTLTRKSSVPPIALPLSFGANAKNSGIQGLVFNPSSAIVGKSTVTDSIQQSSSGDRGSFVKSKSISLEPLINFNIPVVPNAESEDGSPADDSTSMKVIAAPTDSIMASNGIPQFSWRVSSGPAPPLPHPNPRTSVAADSLSAVPSSTRQAKAQAAVERAESEEREAILSLSKKASMLSKSLVPIPNSSHSNEDIPPPPPPRAAHLTRHQPSDVGESPPQLTGTKSLLAQAAEEDFIMGLKEEEPRQMGRYLYYKNYRVVPRTPSSVEKKLQQLVHEPTVRNPRARAMAATKVGGQSAKKQGKKQYLLHPMSKKATATAVAAIVSRQRSQASSPSNLHRGRLDHRDSDEVVLDRPPEPSPASVQRRIDMDADEALMFPGGTPGASTPCRRLDGTTNSVARSLLSEISADDFVIDSDLSHTRGASQVHYSLPQAEDLILDPATVLATNLGLTPQAGPRAELLCLASPLNVAHLPVPANVFPEGNTLVPLVTLLQESPGCVFNSIPTDDGNDTAAMRFLPKTPAAPRVALGSPKSAERNLIDLMDLDINLALEAAHNGGPMQLFSTQTPARNIIPDTLEYEDAPTIKAPRRRMIGAFADFGITPLKTPGAPSPVPCSYSAQAPSAMEPTPACMPKGQPLLASLNPPAALMPAIDSSDGLGDVEAPALTRSTATTLLPLPDTAQMLSLFNSAIANVEAPAPSIPKDGLRARTLTPINNSNKRYGNAPAHELAVPLVTLEGALLGAHRRRYKSLEAIERPAPPPPPPSVPLSLPAHRSPFEFANKCITAAKEYSQALLKEHEQALYSCFSQAFFSGGHEAAGCILDRLSEALLGEHDQAATELLSSSALLICSLFKVTNEHQYGRLLILIQRDLFMYLCVDRFMLWARVIDRIGDALQEERILGGLIDQAQTRKREKLQKIRKYIKDDSTEEAMSDEQQSTSIFKNDILQGKPSILLSDRERKFTYSDNNDKASAKGIFSEL